MGCCISKRSGEGHTEFAITTEKHISLPIDTIPSGSPIIAKQTQPSNLNNVTNISNLNSNPSNHKGNASMSGEAPGVIADLPISVSLIPKEEASRAPKLQVIVMEGPVLEKDTTFEINACGYVSSLRNASDGCVYMGTQEKNPQTGDYVNDIVIPQEETGMGLKHLIIKYRMELKSYYLKDMGEGTGTFVKIESPLALKQGYIISFGDSHMVVNIRNHNKIQLKFLDGPKSEQTFTFNEVDGEIKIGRMSDCDIKFDDNSLSRYQCCLRVEDGEWTLQDGDGRKASTNGTWLFVDDFFLISDGTIFKAGQTLFRIKFHDPGL